MDTRQPLSLATSVITKLAHEQRGQSGKDECYAWAHQHGLPLIKGDLAMTTMEFPICQQRKTTLNSPVWHNLPGVINKLLGGGFIL